MKKYDEIYRTLVGNKRIRSYCHKHHPDFESYLTEKFGFANTWPEMLYCYEHDIMSTPLCPVCGKPVKFQSSTGKYSKYCSIQCTNNDPIRQEAIRKKHKDGHPNSTEEVQRKRRETCRERYGVDHPMNLDAIKQKVENTTLERYGVRHVQQSTIVQEKTRRTNLERYGVEYTTQTQSMKDASRKTSIERYGVDHPMKVTDIKSKCFESITKTNLERYGVEYIMQSPEMRKLSMETNLRRYGHRCTLLNPTIRDKAIQTSMERYGVPFNCMRKECQASHSNKSKPNDEFASVLQELNIDFEREFPLSRRCYDFKIGNVLVEIDPYATHNSTWGIFGEPKSSIYHSEKTILAESNSFRCIHVWDWDDINIIARMLTQKTRVYARRCDVRNVPVDDCMNFLKENHIQGSCRCQSIRLGLYYKDELVCLMTFGKPRYNKKYQYELLRLCTKYNKNVIGGSSKLFKYFIDNYSPNNIISYCDRSKFSGDVYQKLGFKLHSESGPTKHWYNGKTHQHITNNLLMQRGFDQLFGTEYGKNTSNEQLMLESGFVEIYDCGQSTYTYEKPNLSKL